MTTIVNGLDELRGAVGKDLGVTDWLAIDQARVDKFADATGDHQWIHVDPDRAAKGPFGATIAHGYLTMSLASYFLPFLIDVRGVSMGLNYGVDKVRFPNPVRVGSRIRGKGQIASVEEVKGGVQAKIVITIEIDGQDKPACVVESLCRYLA